ncbi:tRNA pseudouridine synthase A [Pelistega indica]|uniref:tRNA pseudouridine synthase A n=1 Tax=Pelistega indica TaxID=1414851 RepID=V8G7M2_9BURK|nr:tRNA pseudouridine(38-40) synthase TruA [Pelistega indica]ETD71692.1 tRNA pseudouridine synthase A [Pelistega indica]
MQENIPLLKRMSLGIAYDGQAFNGWQTQPNGNTVQDYLERALTQFTDSPVATICAGRTDTGVHGIGQVVHFDTYANRRLYSWVRGVNALLPPTIRVRWAQEVSDDFHARFSAIARTYVYILRNETHLAPSWVGRAGLDFNSLNIEAMRQAGQYLVGQHDFSSFRSSICQAKSPVRTLELLDIQQQGVFIIFTLKANAFLHHMVRNIIGALVYVGKGRYQPEWIQDLLAQKDRKFSAPTFMPDGLYLVDVEYPENFHLPASAFDLKQPLQSLIQAL